MFFMCNICNSQTEAITQAKEKTWVLSDGRALRAMAHLHICSKCGHVQKYVDAAYQAIIKNTYETYQVNLLEGNIDQMTFQSDGTYASRLGVLIAKIKQENILHETGRFLDVGCAKGLFLKEFNKEFPLWDLYGQEYDTSFKERILQIPGVGSFYTKDEIIQSSMHCISMNHVLEHVLFPAEMLRSHHALLEGDGFHFVQVPTFMKDPFELCTLDHISHFTHNVLASLAKSCGYSIISTTDGWTQKHTGWLAKKCIPEPMDKKTVHIEEIKNTVQQTLMWLDALPPFVIKYAKNEILGIFGTAPASSWIAEAIENRNAFFVDEDPLRQGTELMGKIIYAPHNCPNGAYIFLPFAPEQARKLSERLKRIYPNLHFFYSTKDILR